MTLKELLRERTDFDMAMYHLACSLGLMESDNFGKVMGVLNSNNEISKLLYEILENLVEIGFLEVNDYGYRWNEKYKGTWES